MRVAASAAPSTPAAVTGPDTAGEDGRSLAGTGSTSTTAHHPYVHAACAPSHILGQRTRTRSWFHRPAPRLFARKATGDEWQAGVTPLPIRRLHDHARRTSQRTRGGASWASTRRNHDAGPECIGGTRAQEDRLIVGAAVQECL